MIILNKQIVFSATGDSFITRRLPSKDGPFQELSSLLKNTDVRFTNLEVTTHNHEGEPGAVSGGTWAIAAPTVLEDLKDYGFNLVAWANNHTLDYSFGGLHATERSLNQYGFIHAGAGKNLAKASEPRYLETASGRVALISVTSSFHESWIAGNERPDMMGRPGVNPLRYHTIYTVTSEKMKQLKSIAEAVNINAEYDLSVKDGFIVEEDDELFYFGGHYFKEGVHEGESTTPSKVDLERISRSIREASRQADYVLVSIHAHEMQGKDLSQPAEFLNAFSRRCIDEGAHSVIGHGPHIVRGIEIYKERPIFYSLGNFIFQNETVTHLPADFYEKYGLTNTHSVADALDVRSKNETRGFGTNPKIWSSFVPVWKMVDGKLSEIELYPVELGYGLSRYQRGWPALTDDTNILVKLQELSKPFGTEIKIDNGIGKITI